MNELRYSPAPLLRRSGAMLFAAIVVIADFVVHADGGFPSVFGLGFVPSATLLAVAVYLVGVTMVLTTALARHGGVAVAADANGLVFHSAWFGQSYAWRDISRTSLELRYTKYRSYPVIAVHDVSGIVRCHSIDVRLLIETLDQVGDWVAGAERLRVQHGGSAYVAPTTGLGGYNARNQAAELAADMAGARASRAA